MSFLPRRPIAALVASIAVSSLAFAEGEPSRDLAGQLQGWYEAVAGPGNHLKVLIQPAGAGVGYSYNFDVTIQGKYEKRNTNIQGTLHIEREGEGVRFRWESRKGGCDIPLRRAGDGFEGETLAGACLTAFQNPVPGKWKFEIEPGGMIRIRSVDTGETLRFRKTTAPSKRS